MKLQTILRENQTLTPRDLDTYERAVLNKSLNGTFEIENASEREYASALNLVHYGLLSDGTFELTPRGTKAAEILKANMNDPRGFTPDRAEARFKDDKLGRTGGKPAPYGADGIDDEPPTEVSPFKDQWGSVRNPD